MLDTDGSGEITIEELTDPLVSLGFASGVEEVQSIMEAIDSDHSGSVGFDEFLAILSKSESGNDALVNLYSALSSGEIGSRELSLSSNITTYRRRMLMEALMSHGDWRDAGSPGGETGVSTEKATATPAAASPLPRRSSQRRRLLSTGSQGENAEEQTERFRRVCDALSALKESKDVARRQTMRRSTMREQVEDKYTRMSEDKVVKGIKRKVGRLR